MKCYARGATPIVFQSLREMPLFGDALAYCVVARVERPLFAGYRTAREPPTCSYLPLSRYAIVCLQQAFFGQPLTKAF